MGAAQDARQQNVHFSARVVALNSRIGALTKQLKEAVQREQGLQAQVLPLPRLTLIEISLRAGAQTWT